MTEVAKPITIEIGHPGDTVVGRKTALPYPTNVGKYSPNFGFCLLFLLAQIYLELQEECPVKLYKGDNYLGFGKGDEMVESRSGMTNRISNKANLFFSLKSSDQLPQHGGFISIQSHFQRNLY